MEAVNKLPDFATIAKKKSPDAILLKTAWGQSFNRPDLN
jgi:hypothetical protein